MTEQSLDDADIGALLQKMGGEAVPQRLHGDGLADPGDERCAHTGFVERRSVNRTLATWPRE